MEEPRIRPFEREPSFCLPSSPYLSVSASPHPPSPLLSMSSFPLFYDTIFGGGTDRLDAVSTCFAPTLSRSRNGI